jgi:PAS domain S-box-containing protein
MTLSERRPIRGVEAARGDESTPVVEELYRLTDRLYRAETPNDVYEAALDAITRALGCTRASVVLLDDTGIMRFAAWRGLSDAYRRAVEGHSPWPRDVKDPQPVCIDDVHTTDFPESLKDTVKDEHIGALAFFPLVVNNALIGKFMTYYDARHVFSDAELALALTIARQLGFSLQRRKAEEALRATQRQLVSELGATRQLQKISTQLIHANDAQVLYEEILEAAVAIMGSDFASMQMFYPERGELRLLAHRGFNPIAATSFEWVRPGSGTSCSVALATGNRSIVPDIELSDFMSGSEELETCRQTGIRATQSTPLFSRAGRLLGMISTHWREPHEPSKRDLRLLDVLARQAADLIERKQAELTDQRLAAIVDSSHDAIVSKDLHGLITTWNRGAERLFGYAASEMIGRSITTLIPPDRQHEEVRILDRIRRGDGVDPYETLRQRADGSLVDVSVSVSPLRNSAGEVIGASKIARDITDRKRAEARLAERNAQLDLAGNIARIGSFTYDHPTKKLQLSPGCAAIYGLPDGTHEISREDWRARVHPEDLLQLDTVTRGAITNGERECILEFRIFRHGQVRWIESRIRISYSEAGKPVRTIGAEIDVTERKLAELALAERNMQFALAAKAALVGSYAYDVDTDTMQVDEGYAALHKLPGTSTTRSEWKTRAHPEDLDRLETVRSEAFRERRSEYGIEYRIVRSGGEVRWIESRSFMSYNSDGRPQRVVGVNIDITERKRAEEQLHRLVAELDHRVKNVLAAVSAIAAHTKDASSSMDDFVAALDRRIRSMASTHELLSNSCWQGVPLRELLRRELAPYTSNSNTCIEGPEVILRPEAAQTTASVLHELTTNAAKYGALSKREGRVSVRWHCAPNGQAPAPLAIEWLETGGPPVKAPSDSGYGRSVITELMSYELGGTARLLFSPEGVRCRLDIPAIWLAPAETEQENGAAGHEGK